MVIPRFASLSLRDDFTTEDKPVNKMLHLATSFISSVVKLSIKDDEAKRGVTITAIMVDLAIDFFCKK